MNSISTLKNLNPITFFSVQKAEKEKNKTEQVMLPKKKKSAYQNFFVHARKKIRQVEPNLRFGELSEKVSLMWKQLSPDEKRKYDMVQYQKTEEKNKIKCSDFEIEASKLARENTKLKRKYSDLEAQNLKLNVQCLTLEKTLKKQIEKNSFIGNGIIGNGIIGQLANIIKSQEKSQNEGDKIWENSPYSSVNHLKANNVGNCGEIILKQLCEQNNIFHFIDGAKTKNQKKGDGQIKGKSIEIKTARRGKQNTFQHELGEEPWVSDYLVFIDINPQDFYIVIMKNFEKEFYEDSNEKKVLPYFDKKICRRKKEGNYKLTLSKNDLEKNCRHVLRITRDTKGLDAKHFIEMNIC